MLPLWSKGQHVRTLAKGMLGKGSHQLKWNGKDDSNNAVGTGIYLVKVKTKDKAQMMKMMLMK